MFWKENAYKLMKIPIPKDKRYGASYNQFIM